MSAESGDSLPDTFAEFASVCAECRSVVDDPDKLNEGLCGECLLDAEVDA